MAAVTKLLFFSFDHNVVKVEMKKKKKFSCHEMVKVVEDVDVVEK